MQSRSFQPTLQWQGQEFGQPGLHQTQSPAQRLLVSPLSHPSMALHRQVLVGNLFKHAKETQRIDNGYLAVLLIERSGGTNRNNCGVCHLRMSECSATFVFDH